MPYTRPEPPIVTTEPNDAFGAGFDRGRLHWELQEPALHDCRNTAPALAPEGATDGEGVIDGVALEVDG